MRSSCYAQVLNFRNRAVFAKSVFVSVALLRTGCVVLRQCTGSCPLEVLLVAFQKTRRAARTDKFLRMSRRLAGTKYRVSAEYHVRTSKSVHQSVRFDFVKALQLSEARNMSKRSGQWRQLSDCVSLVLRDVRVVAVPAVERPVAAKVN